MLLNKDVTLMVVFKDVYEKKKKKEKNNKLFLSDLSIRKWIIPFHQEQSLNPGHNGIRDVEVVPGLVLGEFVSDVPGHRSTDGNQRWRRLRCSEVQPFSLFLTQQNVIQNRFSGCQRVEQVNSSQQFFDLWPKSDEEK